jgi:archaellum component FlaC/nitrogen fixation protein
MKKTLLMILFFSFAIHCWGQEKERHIILEKDYHDKDLKNEKDTIIKGRVNRGVRPEETNTYVIEYDFKSGVYNRNMLNLEINTPVVFKIININRLAYDVKVTPRDSILADTGWENGVLEFLKENTLPTTTNAKEEENKAKLNSETKSSALEKDDVKDGANDKGNTALNLNTILSNIKADKDAIQEEIAKNELIKKPFVDRKKELENAYPKIEEDITKLKIQISKYTLQDLNTESKSIEIKEKNDQLESLNKVKTEISLKNEEINKIDKLIKEDSLKLQQINRKADDIEKDYKDLESEYNSYTETFNKLKNSYFKILNVNECYNEVRLYMSNPLLSKDDYEKEYANKALQKLEQTFPSLRSEYQNFLDIYIKLGHEFYSLSQNGKVLELDFGGQTKFLNPAKNMKSLADNWNEEFNKADIKALMHEMNRAYQLLKKPDVYTYVSKPIQPVKDVVIFDIKIKKYNQDKPNYNDDKEFSYKEYTKGGMRFDAGVGFAISYLDNAAEYEIAPKKDTNEDVIALKEKHLWVPSFVGLFTANFRSNKLATFGISAGIGVSADSGKFEFSNFYFGPSITLGRENRICFTAGATIKGVEELNKNVTEGTPVPNTNNVSSFTNNTYVFGPFVSITYNLTKGIRNNVKYFKK